METNYSQKPIGENKQLSIEEMAKYKESEGLGRLWKKIEYGISGHGIVDTSTIDKTLAQNPELVEDLKKERNNLVGELVGDFVKHDKKINMHVANIIGRSGIDNTPKNREVVLNCIAKAISQEVGQSLNSGKGFDIHKCMSNLNTVLTYPYLLAEHLPQDSKDAAMLDQLTKLDPKQFSEKIEGRIDLYFGKNTYLAEEILSGSYSPNEDTLRIANQIRDISRLLH